MDKKVQFQEVSNIVKGRLGEKRFLHCLGVAETAEKLAALNNVDTSSAYLAGLVHDYARNFEDATLLELAQANLQLEPADLLVPVLLHGPVAACLLPTELGICDQNILGAVSHHTLGRVGMNTLEQIVFIADMIEPNRSYPGVKELRTTTFSNLTAGVLAGFNHTIAYIAQSNDYLHPRTVLARNYIWHLIKTQKDER